MDTTTQEQSAENEKRDSLLIYMMQCYRAEDWAGFDRASEMLEAERKKNLLQDSKASARRVCCGDSTR